MNQSQIDEELATPGAQELLGSTSAAHLAYVAPDGTPRVVPVGFYWTGEQLVIATATTAPKVKALSARPEVAMSIDAGGTPGAARSLSIRGRADLTVVEGVVEEYLLAARENMDADAYVEFERACRGMYEQMVRIAVTPTWVRYYNFGAGRMPQFLQELAAKST